MKYIGKIPVDKIDEGNIKWLVIETHIHNKLIVGYYMYLYEDLYESCKWDNWFQTLQIAFEAGKAYDILESDWEIYDNIIK